MARNVGMATVLGLVYALSSVAGAFAHDPTDGKREYSTDHYQRWYGWSSGTRVPGDPSPVGPTWIQDNTFSALTGDWDIGNNTRAPYFSEWTSGSQELSTLWWATNGETPNTSECPSTLWYACTDYLSDGAASDRWKSTFKARRRYLSAQVKHFRLRVHCGS